MTPRMAVTKILIAAAIAVMGLALMSLTFDRTTAAMPADLNPAVSPPAHVISEMRQAATDASDPVTDTTVADFQAGTGSCYVAPSSGGDIDGELILTPSVGTTFSGTALPTGWYSGTYAADGAGSLSGGLLTLSGAYATTAAYPPSQTLEFSATFSSAAGEHVGLVGTLDPPLNYAPWAIFTTFDGNGLYASTNQDPEGNNRTPITDTNYLDGGHRYRIVWTSTSVIYSIDGRAVVTHTSPLITENMRPVASSGRSGSNLVVDWLRMSPYTTTTTSCAFQSRVFDAGQSAHWQNLNWTGQQSAGTIVGNFETRSGDVATPGPSWSGWTPLQSGTAISVPNGQYVQYRTALTTTDSMQTPVVQSVALSFGPAKQSQTIDFRPLQDKVYGALPFTVVATATSDLQVTFIVGGGACGISGALVTLTSAGTCDVTAQQSGSASYYPAPNVTRSFSVTKATSTVTMTCGAGPFTYTGSAWTPCTAAVTGAGGLSQTLTVSYANNVNAGTASASATFAGDANHTSSSDSKTFTIARADQTITFGALPDRPVSSPPFTVTASASSGLDVTFTAGPSGLCSVTGSTVTLTGVTGTCTVTADQSGSSNYNAAPKVAQSFKIRYKVYLPFTTRGTVHSTD